MCCFATVADEWHPAEASDYVKTLVWSFIAGFAERLVPDTLQGLTRAAQPNKHDQTPTSSIDDARSV